MSVKRFVFLRCPDCQNINPVNSASGSSKNSTQPPHKNTNISRLSKTRLTFWCKLYIKLYMRVKFTMHGVEIVVVLLVTLTWTNKTDNMSWVFISHLQFPTQIIQIELVAKLRRCSGKKNNKINFVYISQTKQISWDLWVPYEIILSNTYPTLYKLCVN